MYIRISCYSFVLIYIAIMFWEMDILGEVTEIHFTLMSFLDLFDID